MLETYIDNYILVYFNNSNTYLILDTQTYPFYKTFKLNKKKHDYIDALDKSYPINLKTSFFDTFTDLSKKTNASDPFLVKNDIEIISNNSKFIQVFGQALQIRYDSIKTLNTVYEKFNHLETTSKCFDETLVVSYDNSGYSLKNKKNTAWHWDDNNIHLFQGKFTFELLNCIHNKKETEWLGTFHASTVGNGKEAIMLVGNSGSGKSTLSSLLMFSGYDLIADDVTPMLGENNHIYVLPAAISIKEKSFDSIKPFVKDFDKLPAIYVNKTKGHQKFIPPKPLKNLSQLDYPCRNIVLVRYSHKPIKTTFNKGDVKIILEELISESWLSHSELHAKSFIKWLSKISFHELRYHYSNEAVSVFNNLIPLA